MGRGGAGANSSLKKKGRVAIDPVFFLMVDFNVADEGQQS